MMIGKIAIVIFALALVTECKVKMLKSFGDFAEFEVQLPTSPNKVKLLLQKSKKFNNIPITMSENGIEKRFNSRLLQDSNHVRYNSPLHEAVVSAKNNNGRMEYSGHFSHKGFQYRIQSLGDGNHHISMHAGPVESVIESKNLIRKRRQSNTSPTTDLVELYLLIDNKIWERYMELFGDESTAMQNLDKAYTHILDGIDTVYRNIGDLSVSVDCIGMTVAKTAADAAWVSATEHDGSKMLDSIEAYYKSKNIEADHIMAFTGYDIYGVNPDGSKVMSVCGMAPVASTCDSARVSINEDGGLQSWATAAHELGHNMASQHDGSGNTCTSSTKNIMAPGLGIFTESDVQNSVKLSSCSIKYMKDYISGLNGAGKNCLTKTTKPRDSTFTTPHKLGKYWDLDRTCQYAYGKNSKFFKTAEVTSKPSAMCASIYCSSPSGGGQTRSGMRAPVGTPCGNKKSCNWGGACVADSDAPEKDESCFFGDNDTKASCDNWKNIMTAYTDYCAYPEYKNYVKTQCCETCKSVCN